MQSWCASLLEIRWLLRAQHSQGRGGAVGRRTCLHVCFRGGMMRTHRWRYGKVCAKVGRTNRPCILTQQQNGPMTVCRHDEFGYGPVAIQSLPNRDVEFVSIPSHSDPRLSSPQQCHILVCFPQLCLLRSSAPAHSRIRNDVGPGPAFPKIITKG
jgi:hypothetical protein